MNGISIQDASHVFLHCAGYRQVMLKSITAGAGYANVQFQFYLLGLEPKKKHSMKMRKA